VIGNPTSSGRRKPKTGRRFRLRWDNDIKKGIKDVFEGTEYIQLAVDRIY
jgi:hypothetical protein